MKPEIFKEQVKKDREEAIMPSVKKVVEEVTNAICGAYEKGCETGLRIFPEVSDTLPIWKPIPKDKDGFVCDEDMLYKQLPFVLFNTDDPYLLEYVCKENFSECLSDMSKPRYTHYHRLMPVPIEEGGDQ